MTNKVFNAPKNKVPQLFIEPYFKLFGGNYILASIVVALFFFFLGIGISCYANFLVVYTSSSFIYLATFGIAWVLTYLGWCNKKFNSMVNEIRLAFLIEEDEFKRIHLFWRRQLFNNRLYIYSAIPFILVVWLLLIFLSIKGIWPWFDLIWSKLPWFLPAWSQDPHLWAKNLILALYIMPIVFLIFTGGGAIIIYNFFVSSLSRLPLIPSIELARAKLRPIADFGISTGIAWSVGISLIVIFFSPSFIVYAVMGVLILIIFGLAVLLWPQYQIHKSLENTKEQLVNDLTIMFRRKLETDKQPRYNVSINHLYKLYDQQIYDFIKLLVEARTWVHEPRDVASILAPWLLPLITLFVTKLL